MRVRTNLEGIWEEIGWEMVGMWKVLDWLEKSINRKG
jgi:hypothetical protein